MGIVGTYFCAGLVVVAMGCGPQSGFDVVTVDGGRNPSEPQDSGGIQAPLIGDVYVHSGETLYLMDANTFDLELIGDFGIERFVTDLAVTNQGEVFGITEESLYRIDTDTGVASYVGDVPGQRNVGMTFLNNGRLLATDKNGGVRSIDPNTGDIQEIGFFGGGYETAGDLVGVQDGRMFAISDQGPVGDEVSNNVLLTIDPVTGRYQQAIGQIGYGRVWGAAATNGKVYAFTGDGEIIEVNPQTGAGSLVREFEELSFWGAAVTPTVVVD